MGRRGNDPTPLDDVGLEEEEPGGQWELDPNDPTHPDHDLSLAHGYANWEPTRQTFLSRPLVMAVLCIVIVVALLVPLLMVV
jgi:hypothetical protein